MSNTITTVQKHTPGPWSLTQIENRIASGNTVIARIYAHTSEGQPSNVAPFTDEDTANAKLIAAAPELLGWLRSLIPSLECRLTSQRRDAEAWDLVSAAKAAIAKAEGGL